MPTNQFPCRLCGQTTPGRDSYVVCQACIDGYMDGVSPAMEHRRVCAAGDDALSATPLSPDEIESRLRRLLNDW